MLKSTRTTGVQELAPAAYKVCDVIMLPSAVICIVGGVKRTSNALLVWPKLREETTWDLFSVAPHISVELSDGRVKCFSGNEVLSSDDTSLLYLVLCVDVTLEVVILSDARTVIDHKVSMLDAVPHYIALNHTCSSIVLAQKESVAFISMSSLCVMSQLAFGGVSAAASIPSHDRYVLLTENYLVVCIQKIYYCVVFVALRSV